MTTHLLSEKAQATLERLLRSYKRNNSKSVSTRLSERVFNYVLENIHSGKFAPGTRITERTLARQLEMSHVPVREAMEKLQQHGWVERIPHKGIYVRDFSDNEVKEIYQLREILEVGAVRIVTEQITAKQLAELKDVVDLLEVSYESSNAEIFKEADIQFHRLLVHYTGIERLENIFDSVVLQARCFFFIGASGEALYARRAREHLESVSHKAIYEAIEARNHELAEKLVRQHIKTGCAMITELRGYLAL